MSEQSRIDREFDEACEPSPEWRCDACKYDNAWDDNFCRYCGEPVEPEGSDDDG